MGDQQILRADHPRVKETISNPLLQESPTWSTRPSSPAGLYLMLAAIPLCLLFQRPTSRLAQVSRPHRRAAASQLLMTKEG